MDKDKACIILPMRIGSTRLANKCIADINGKPMAEHTWRRAIESGFKKVYVATDSGQIRKIIEDLGGNVIMTDPNLASGSDRVYAAYKQLNDSSIEYIVNVQGDMPFVNPKYIEKAIEALVENNADIGTLVCEMDDMEKMASSGKVKTIITKDNKALYFSRSPIPFGATKFYCHLGIYAFNKNSIEKYFALPQSYLELQEKLEQLRALENGMSIGVSFIDEIPISVDLAEDLEEARLHALTWRNG